MKFGVFCVSLAQQRKSKLDTISASVKSYFKLFSIDHKMPAWDRIREYQLGIYPNKPKKITGGEGVADAVEGVYDYI